MRKQNLPSGTGTAGPSRDDAPFVERDERDRAARRSRVSDNVEPPSRGLPHQQHDEAEPYGTSMHTTPVSSAATTGVKDTTTTTPAQPKSPPTTPGSPGTRTDTDTDADADADKSGRASRAERTPRTSGGTSGTGSTGSTSGDGESLLDSHAGDELQGRFRDALASFVDSPADAVSDADDIAAQVVRLVTDAIETRRSELERLHRDAGTDTEKLRLALHKYRSFIQGMSKL